MPSSADLSDALDAATDAVLLAAGAHAHPIILIDGRSGAGKTTLASAVHERLGGGLLALDSLYPGWDGLAAGAETVCRDVLEPLASGRRGRWRRWDWARGAFAEEHEIAPGRPLVIEGSGVLTPASRAVSDVQVWLEAAGDARRERALLRDGDTYRPHWDRWARQEEQHLRDHDPVSLASIVIDLP